MATNGPHHTEVARTGSPADIGLLFALLHADLTRVAIVGCSEPLIAAAAIAAARGRDRGRQVQVFCVDTDLARLQAARDAIRTGTVPVLLYHGDSDAFWRMLGVAPTLLCIDARRTTELRLTCQSIECHLPPHTQVLLVGSDAEGDDLVRECSSLGLMDILEQGDGFVLCRATTSCSGLGWTVTAAALNETAAALEERYSGVDPNAASAAIESSASALLPILRDRARGAAARRTYGPQSPIPSYSPRGRRWPTISIITPSLNQGRFIEQTLQSVAEQGYPAVEHIVIDGGSTDNTTDILDRYRNRLHYVVSEPDGGQSEAINKGMSQASGSILTWLNADDVLAPGALWAVATAFELTEADMVAGVCKLIRDRHVLGQHLTSCRSGILPLDDLLDLERCWLPGQFFYQPEVMFTREIWERAGGYVDESLYYSMDYDLWVRFALSGARLHVIGRPVAHFRIHADQKTCSQERFLPELHRCRNQWLAKAGRSLRPDLPRTEPRTHLRFTFINDHGFHHGAGIAHRRLAESIAFAGHQVHAVSLRPDPDSGAAGDAVNTEVLAKTAQSAGVPDAVIVGNLHSVVRDPWIVKPLAERFPVFCVLHDFWWLTGRCAYTAGQCTQYLSGCTAACPTAMEYPRLRPAEIPEAWRKKRALLAGPHAPTLLANSEWTEQWAREALQLHPGSPATGIYPFRLGFPMHVLQAFDKNESRTLLGLPEHAFIVLLTCEMADNRKGAQRVFDALRILSLPDVIVVSTSWSEAVPTPGIPVIRLGYVHDIEKLARVYAAADLFVAASTEETFGQAYVEAIACGTPVVGFRRSGIAEAVSDGITGVLTDGTTASDLAAAILYLYEHPNIRANLRHFGRVHVENEWSYEACYHALHQVLRDTDVLSRTGLPPKISFLPEPPVIAAARPLAGGGELPQIHLRWDAPYEGPFPEHDLPRLRWATGPETTFAVLAERPGRCVFVIEYRNLIADQEVTVICNGAPAAAFRLSLTGLREPRLIAFEITLGVGDNSVTFGFRRYHKPTNKDGETRKLAMAITDLQCIYSQ